MPSFHDERRVRHRAEQMFALVADVERYPEFVPLCKALKVRSRRIDDDGRETLVAGMTVGYKLIRETFTSRVMLDKPGLKVRVEYVDGPFSHLENIWTFRDEPEGEGSRIGFFIDYEFKSRALGALMGSMFDVAFRKFARAFEQRADAVYGRTRRARQVAPGGRRGELLLRRRRCGLRLGAGIWLFGSPLIAPDIGSLFRLLLVTSVSDSGLMTIITGLPWESLARTRKDEGMIVMLVNPALVRSSRSRWLMWVGAWAFGAAFWSVADPARGSSSRPPPNRRSRNREPHIGSG